MKRSRLRPGPVAGRQGSLCTHLRKILQTDYSVFENRAASGRRWAAIAATHASQIGQPHAPRAMYQEQCVAPQALYADLQVGSVAFEKTCQKKALSEKGSVSVTLPPKRPHSFLRETAVSSAKDRGLSAKRPRSFFDPSGVLSECHQMACSGLQFDNKRLGLLAIRQFG